MKIVHITDGQGSEEWLSWRKNGIGASDISAIVGSNPYRTPLQTWEEKCGYSEETPMNMAMEHGVRNEPVARQWLNEHLSLNLTPVCIEDLENPHFRASLDGYDHTHRTIVEIKCPVSDSVIDASRTSQSIPAYWCDQMQWQIMIANPKRAIFAIWDYRNQNCVLVEMFGSKERIPQLREAGQAFWEDVRSGRPPPATDKDYIKIENEELRLLLEEYQEVGELKKTYTARSKELKEKIIEFGDDGNFKAYGFSVTRIPVPQRYNTKQMELDGINLARYLQRGESIGYYRITCPKKG